MTNASYFNRYIDLSSDPGGVDIFNQNVGFQATAVKVDNYSSYWIFFPNADSFVPPFWAGTILLLRHTTDIQETILKSPDANANPQPFTSPSFFLHLEWTNATDVSFNPGLSVAPQAPIPPAHVIVDNFPTQIPSDVGITGDVDVNVINGPLPVVVVNSAPVSVAATATAVQPPLDIQIPDVQLVEVINPPIPVAVVNPNITVVAPDDVVSFHTQVLTTVISLTAVRAKIPTTNLVGRLSMLIQADPANGSVTIYIGGSTVTADTASTGGIQLGAGMSMPIDADDTVDIYAVCATGQVGKVIVAEAY